MRSMILVMAAAALPLGGCVATLAASAASMAIQSAQPKPQSNAHLKPAALEACTARARQYGAVHIIDVEQRSVNRMIVWGTVTDAKERRSFQCHFTTAIADFKLRAIRTRS
jgi:acyl-coenzyme A thioesterase PaaI-like protein